MKRLSLSLSLLLLTGSAIPQAPRKFAFAVDRAYDVRVVGYSPSFVVKLEFWNIAGQPRFVKTCRLYNLKASEKREVRLAADGLAAKLCKGAMGRAIVRKIGTQLEIDLDLGDSTPLQVTLNDALLLAGYAKATQKDTTSASAEAFARTMQLNHWKR